MAGRIAGIGTLAKRRTGVILLGLRLYAAAFRQAIRAREDLR